jgi:hypothetical protein
MRPNFPLGVGPFSLIPLLQLVRFLLSAQPKPPLAIKSRYLEHGHQFEDGPILRMIHEDCDFLGVVRLLPTGLKPNEAEQKLIAETDATPEEEEVEEEEDATSAERLRNCEDTRESATKRGR